MNQRVKLYDRRFQQPFIPFVQRHAQLRVLPLCTRPLLAGRTFRFGASGLCGIGGVAIIRRTTASRRCAASSPL
jgi:hypothetical protein